MVAEVVGGLLSNSLALLADAGHMLTDAGALGLSLFVAWMCRQPSRPREDVRLSALGDPRRADQRRDAAPHLVLDRVGGDQALQRTRSRSRAA